MLMNLIRSEKPQHEYFRILNEIEVIVLSVLIVHLWKICQLEVLANYVVPNKTGVYLKTGYATSNYKRKNVSWSVIML